MVAEASAGTANELIVTTYDSSSFVPATQDRSNKISVILASHNGQAFISQQLHSIALQSFSPLEIIVSDDNSQDRTAEIVSEFARLTKIPVILSVNRPALGFADNFMMAAERANGDLVAFCDQDDVWHPEKLATIQKYFDDERTVLAVHRARKVDQSGKPIGLFDQGITSTAIKPPLSYSPWDGFFGFSMVFRRSLLCVIPGIDRGIDYITGGQRLAHDRWILYLANLVGQTAELHDALVDYRQHSSNLFGANPPRANAFNQTDIVLQSKRYLQAAYEMRKLIDRVSLDAGSQFPLFDRDAAEAFWDLAIKQQAARADIYNATRRSVALSKIVRNFFKSVYLNVNDRQMRWQSLMKDLIYVAKWGSRLSNRNYRD